ncbi:hypothetical protein BJY04DRAFT_183424 [Aspergillus karnatakaensis]|uniref:uncharacterized protein n=1 Tax=Aspergillus karnatakaensis TaxID=1810916 RepID=UPI003CCDA038
MPVLPDPKKFTQGDDKKETHDQESIAQEHASKGPQIPDKMPEKASREETEARMKELNNK